ncbi:unnamed protein product, partial [Sphacelaria rigidula]
GAVFSSLRKTELSFLPPRGLPPAAPSPSREVVGTPLAAIAGQFDVGNSRVVCPYADEVDILQLAAFPSGRLPFVCRPALQWSLGPFATPRMSTTHQRKRMMAPTY